MSGIRRKDILRYMLIITKFMLEKNTYEDKGKYDVTFKTVSYLNPFSLVQS